MKDTIHMLTRNDLCRQLDELSITYQVFEHPALFKASDVVHFPLEVKKGLEGSIETKNLFLRDEKRASYILVCIRADTRVKLKELGRQLGIKGITFCSAEELNNLLGITPGSVCLFTLANDSGNYVKGYIDASIPPEAIIQNHPLDNTATVVLKASSMIYFCKRHNHEVLPLHIPAI